MKCKGSVHGQRLTDQEGELPYIPAPETSRGDEKNKNTSKAAQQMQRQKIHYKNVAKERVPQKGFERSRDLQPVLHNKQTQLLHFQQRFLTSCQYDPSWIVPAIPEAMLTAVFKANSATSCWRCPHLRATGKCRPSIKHKMQMHYHLECIMGEQPWDKRKFSDRKS